MTTLARMQHDLAVAIQAQIAGDADKWRLIRRLSLEADGRSGYNDFLKLAYTRGRWNIPAVRDGAVQFFIDLYAPRVHRLGGSMPADHEVCGLALDQINPNAIIANLSEIATRPAFRSIVFTPMSEERRDQLAREAGFERVGPLGEA